jgi:hypothetical protein
MSLPRIVGLLEAVRARRLSSGYPLWQVSKPRLPGTPRARRFNPLRAAILAGTMALPTPAYLVISANPQEYEVGGPWAHAGPETWSVPASCHAPRLLENLLYQGSWHLYTAARAIESASLPDTFRWSPRGIAEFAVGESLSVLIHADSTNRRWRVWVEQAASQHRVAA